MRSTLVWIALGLVVGLVIGKRPPEVLGWPACLDSFGTQVGVISVHPDDENGVLIEVSSTKGNFMKWSIHPDEARVIAGHLEDSADATEYARQDGGLDL